MCGIAGWIDYERNILQHEDIIKKMGETMTHRGPDNHDTWVSEHVGLAHTRLIVIDPEGGAQPMTRRYGNHSFVIVYNGELYNTEELRNELKEKGHSFYTNSDTEVLLVSYIEWQEKCVDHLNGIYAFAIYDEFRQQTFLARDRLGVKPLFFARRESSLVFGSELKSLLANPLVKPEVDKDGLSEVFGLGPSRTPGIGVFKDVYEVRPGHFLLYKRGQMDIKQYWSLESKTHEDDMLTTVHHVKELVFDAIKRQLVSDVPVCTFLSGGLDSSIISAVAAKVHHEKGLPLHTYSIDYIGNNENFKPSEFQPNSDAPFVQLMSDYLHSSHHKVMIKTEDLVSALQEAVRARDLPGMADVDSSLYLFSKEVKKGATVGLSGECADEIFGGYPWFFRQEDLQSNTFPWLRSIHERENLLSQEIKSNLNIKEYVQERYLETLQEVPRLKGESIEQNKMRELFYLNMTWFMATLLERKDRMTMATGLEVRVPFADHRIVEYLWNVPWEMKMLHQREKGLLRHAVENLLPDEIVNRKKSPYPKTHNPAYTRAVSEAMREILNSPNSPILHLIDREKVSAIVESNGKSFRVPWFGQLMTGPQLLAYLIQVNFWLKEYNVKVI